MKKSKPHYAALNAETSPDLVVEAIGRDDFAWAKPYVDQARTSLARRDVLSGEEYFKRLNAKLEAFRSE